MKIFRRQSSRSQFSSLEDESSTTRDDAETSGDARLRPYSVVSINPLRDHRGIDTSSIFRSRWTASMPCLGDMTQTDMAAESLLSSTDENPLHEQPLMEDEKLVVSLVDQEKLRHEADGLVIGETPVGWIRARRQVRHRMGHSVRTVHRAFMSKSIGAAARRSHDEDYNKHSTPISSDEENNIVGHHLDDEDDDDDDDDDSIVSFNTENFIKPLAVYDHGDSDGDGDARRRGSESRRARRRRRLRIVRDNLKKTVLLARPCEYQGGEPK
jgi:hypothetical protein